MVIAATIVANGVNAFAMASSPYICSFQSRKLTPTPARPEGRDDRSLPNPADFGVCSRHQARPIQLGANDPEAASPAALATVATKPSCQGAQSTPQSPAAGWAPSLRSGVPHAGKRRAPADVR